MSIGTINGASNWWYWQNQAAQASQPSTTSTTATNNGGAITNAGTLSAGSNASTFLQAFSADLQAMLAQMGSAAATTTATSAAANGATTTAGSTGQTASIQTQSAPHHHHHHSDGDDSGSMQMAANQLVGEIGQSVQNGTLTSSGINNSASSFAADVVQALQAYGLPTLTNPTSAIVA